MTNYCPNCNHEFAPEDEHCANCGRPRPAAIQKLPTLVLSQAEQANLKPKDPAPAPVPESASMIAPAFPMANGGFSSIPAPAVATLATEETRPAQSEDEEKTEPSLPTFWQCTHCVSLNPSTADYCETCGALKPSTEPVKLGQEAPPPPPAAAGGQPPAKSEVPARAKAGEVDTTTTKLPSDVIAALASEHGDGRFGWRLVSGSGTDEGVTRRGGINEDSYFLAEMRRCFESQPEVLGIYIVADGMGGQAAGEFASRTAIETVVPILISELAGPWTAGENLDPATVEEILRTAISLAHTRLRDFNLNENLDVGTTMTACCVLSDWAIFANVGDSRTYLFRVPKPPKRQEKTDPVLQITIQPDMDVTQPVDQRVTRKLMRSEDKQTDQLRPPEQAEPPPDDLAGLIIDRVTKDQSLVQHLVDRGEIKAEEVYSDPRRNVILYALGSPEEQVPVDTYLRNLEAGDTILLCSDGLWEMVRDKDIAAQVQQNTSLQVCVDNLIGLANANGGADNITVIAVRVENK